MSDKARVYNLDDYRCPTEPDDNVREEPDEWQRAGRVKKAAMVVAGMALMAWAVIDMVCEEAKCER